MASDEKAARWQFTKSQLANSPSRAHGVDSSKELRYRQQTANLIQDIGRHLTVTQLVINTAIVYMHRFYMHHSFKAYHSNNVAPAFLFLACKVEEQPRKLEHVVTVAYACLHRGDPPIDTSSEEYKTLCSEVIKNELLILQTLGFDVQIRHPHPDVVECTQLVRAPKDLAQTAYFMAHNSLLLTTMCLQYKPSVVACVCIHLACQWKGVEIPRSSDNKQWWSYVDDNITLDLLNELAREFVEIYESCPSRFRAKIDSKHQSSHGDKSSRRREEDVKKFSTSSKHSSKFDVNSKDSSSVGSTVKTNIVTASTGKLDSKLHHHSSATVKLSHRPHMTGNQQKELKQVMLEGKAQSKDGTASTEDATVKVKRTADALSLEAYKQKRAKQQIELEQQQQTQKVIHSHHRSSHDVTQHHKKRSLNPTGDEQKVKKMRRDHELTSSANKDHRNAPHLKDQLSKQLATVKHTSAAKLPSLPPTMPRPPGNSPPPPR